VQGSLFEFSRAGKAYREAVEGQLMQSSKSALQWLPQHSSL
jgi:hypothetical protein